MVAITKELESILPILYTVLSCCCIVVIETEAIVINPLKIE